MTSPFTFTRGAGGQFSGSVGGVPMPPTMAALYKRLGSAAGGPMSFNGKTGTGYGVVGGDARVKLLQQALNAAGFTDGQGRPLAVDGKLGPLTTAALKSAQRQLGVTPDGVATPKLLAQISDMPKAAPKPGPTPAAKPKAAAVKKPTARSKFQAAAPKTPAPAAPVSREPSYQRGAVKFR